MKKIIILIFSGLFNQAMAQPVVQNGNNLVPIGFTSTVYAIVSNSPSITSGGANHTWDFSNMAFNAVATLNVIDPQTSPLASSFPTSNFAFTFGNTYSFYKSDATQMEILAEMITAPGSDGDHSPNPRTILKFPFNFNDTLNDTYQKVGQNQYNVTLYYDSYGTLITPYGSFNDVVRIRENYGSGEDDYRWYSLNPLMPVALFNHDDNSLYLIPGNPATAINSENLKHLQFEIFPNPAKEILTLTNLPLKATITISNALGKTILSTSNSQCFDQIKTASLTNGVYFIRVFSNGQSATKRLIINR